MLNDQDKHEIIKFVNDNLEGESTCDDSDDEMVVFTFENNPENQCLIGTETILDLLKIGYYVLFAGLDDYGKFQLAVSDSRSFKE